MTFRTRVLAGAGAFLGVAALSGVWLWSPGIQNADTSGSRLMPVAMAEGPESSEKAVKAPPKCDEIEARIRKFYDALPRELSGISGAAADNLALETEKTINACGLFLAECESHPKMAEVSYITGKLRFLMSARLRNDIAIQHRDKPGYLELLKQRMGEYMAGIAALARTAFEKLPPSDPLRPRALQLIGQASAEGDRNIEARAAYEKFLELFPGDEEADNITTALARTLLDLEKFDDGIKICKQGLEKYYKSEQYAYLNEILWKLVHSKGDFDGMLECVKRVETVHAHKLSGEGIKDQDRETLERFLDFNGFRQGYTLFARGEFEAAKSAFRSHMETLDKKAERLQKSGKELKPEIKIYRDRSATLLKVLEELAGLPAPVDFDLGNTWVTAKTTRLAESRGKVVGLVLRGVGDERSAAFIGPLSQWVARQPNMDLVSVHFRKAGQNIAQLQDELKEELARVQYDSAAGFDPDEQNKTIFRRHLANVGSATFIVFNRRGELVWFQQDPRGVDVHFAEALMRQWALR